MQFKTLSGKRLAQAFAIQIEHSLESGIAGLPDKTTSLGDLLMRYQKTFTPHKKIHKDEARREWGVYLNDNPLEAVKKPKLNKGRERRLLSGEYEALMLALSGSNAVYLGTIIDLALSTAMRQSELLQLKWNNVCLDRRLIRITDTKNDVIEPS